MKVFIESKLDQLVGKTNEEIIAGFIASQYNAAKILRLYLISIEEKFNFENMMNSCVDYNKNKIKIKG